MSKVQRLFTFKSYLSYLQKAQGAHGLHSPYIFNLWENVISPSKKFRFRDIEDLKYELKNSKTEIQVEEFKTGETAKKSIGSIAKSSLSSSRFSSFMYFFLKHLKIERALETGTSLGVNTMYMARGCQRLISIEGNLSIGGIANSNFEKLNIGNIELETRNIKNGIGDILDRFQPELVFLDADHRSKTTFSLLEEIKKTPSVWVVVIHDIYWSSDMNQFWQEALTDDYFECTVDLFQSGVLIKHNMVKQHFIVKF